MTRSKVARGFLLSAVLLAFALGRTWSTVTQDNAGSIFKFERNGAVTIPVLDALLAMTLISMLALFLLPRLGQRIVLGLTGLLALVGLVLTALWIVDHQLSLGPVVALGASATAGYVAVRGMGSQGILLGPAAKRTDPWRDLDNGVDPTVDQ